jgi:hypothetical protein
MFVYLCWLGTFPELVVQYQQQQHRVSWVRWVWWEGGAGVVVRPIMYFNIIFTQNLELSYIDLSAESADYFCPTIIKKMLNFVSPFFDCLFYWLKLIYEIGLLNGGINMKHICSDEKQTDRCS